MMLRFMIAGLAVATFSGSASAQDEEDRTYTGDGVYFRIGVGASFASDLDQDINNNPNLVFVAAAPQRQSLNVDSTPTFAGALGFDYADGIRTELEYRYANANIESITVSDSINPDIVMPTDESLSAHLLMANFYFDLNNDSNLTPFIGGGVGGAFVTNENGDRDSALAYQGRAGVSYDFGGGISISAEYIYTRSRDLAFGPNDDDFTPSGPFEPRYDGAPYVSSSAMVSFRKQF